MSNGGYKGASPARETSPEQYPGVWELTEQFQAQADGNWPFQADDNAPKRLEVERVQLFYHVWLLLRVTDASPGMSMWVKRAKLSENNIAVFGAGQQSTNDGKYARFSFMADGTLQIKACGLKAEFNKPANNKFRDFSAWYGIIRHDSTETDQEDRLLFVNGELITS